MACMHLVFQAWSGQTCALLLPLLRAVEDVVALLRLGQSNRRTGETNMNERSSRSHRCGRGSAGGLPRYRHHVPGEQGRLLQ